MWVIPITLAVQEWFVPTYAAKCQNETGPERDPNTMDFILEFKRTNCFNCSLPLKQSCRKEEENYIFVVGMNIFQICVLYSKKTFSFFTDLLCCLLCLHLWPILATTKSRTVSVWCFFVEERKEKEKKEKIQQQQKTFGLFCVCCAIVVLCHCCVVLCQFLVLLLWCCCIVV